jgi:rhodanese-related sulfurtransferase
LLLDQGYVYLDVRSEPEFALGHPEGAYNIPLKFQAPGGMVDNPDFLAVVRATFPPTQALVLGCRSGSRSRTAALRLLDAGYTSVVEQRAGYDGVRDPFGQLTEPGWHASGLPTGFEPVPGRDYAALKLRTP